MSDTNDGMEKRTVKLTSKALACKIEQLQKECQSNVQKIKGRTQEIKHLMKNDENAKDVKLKLDKLIHQYENAKTAHESVIMLLSEDDLEIQNNWFQQITKHNNDFMEDVQQWLLETGRRPFLQTGHVTANEPIAANTDIPLILPDEAPANVKEQFEHTEAQQDVLFPPSNMKATSCTQDTTW